MKKIILICIILTIAGVSCNDESGSTSDSQFNLTAPNGIVLAKSIEEVSKWTAELALEKFGTEMFDLKSIEYLPAAKGMVAKINFVANGITSHYLVMQGNENAVSGRTLVECVKWKVSCSGSTCCTPGFNLNTGQASCTCSDGNNSGCTLNVECIQQGEE